MPREKRWLRKLMLYLHVWPTGNVFQFVFKACGCVISLSMLYKETHEERCLDECITTNCNKFTKSSHGRVARPSQFSLTFLQRAYSNSIRYMFYDEKIVGALIMQLFEALITLGTRSWERSCIKQDYYPTFMTHRVYEKCTNKMNNSWIIIINDKKYIQWTLFLKNCSSINILLCFSEIFMS